MAAQPYPSCDLLINVRRQNPELIFPAKPTHHEVKFLSDIDDHDSLRFHVPFLFFYRSEPSMAGKDPVKVIRDALAKTLVFYYPLAGRLKEGEGHKLMVECNEECAIFIEADADVTLEQFGDELQPPFLCLKDLLHSPSGSEGILHSPILLIQVTRLKCGAFIVGVRMNHTMYDGSGLVQFMVALAEIANGATKPSIEPVWQRELLNARDPPQITCTHHEYESEVVNNTTNPTTKIIAHRSFFFGPTEISSLRRSLHNLQCTSFELITACLWKCRTKALQLEPHEHVRLMVVTNTRFGNSRLNPPLPKGYYGNAFVIPAAVATAGEICERPLGYAWELLKKAKAKVNDEYVHSACDLIATRRPTNFGIVRSCIISDLRNLGFRDVDFGWGKAIFAGPANSGAEHFQRLTFYIGHKNSRGEEGRIVSICLPTECMDRFARELDRLLNGYVPLDIQESSTSTQG